MTIRRENELHGGGKIERLSNLYQTEMSINKWNGALKQQIWHKHFSLSLTCKNLYDREHSWVTEVNRKICSMYEISNETLGKTAWNNIVNNTWKR